MSVTVSSFMAELGWMLQEDRWDTNRFWSADEILKYINVVCKDFILRSQILKMTFPIEALPTQRLYADPAQTMDVDRVTFGSKALYATNQYMLDRESPKWKTTTGVPKQYHQDLLPTKTFETDKAPKPAMTGTGYFSTLPGSDRGGLLREMSGSFGYTARNADTNRGGVLRYVLGPIPYNGTLLFGRPYAGILRQMFNGQTNFEVVATTLPFEVSGVASTIPVPDFCKLYIKFGVLKKMLEKQGEGQDLVRAQYCAARYDHGISLFRRLMDGSSSKTAPASGGRA